MKTSSRIVLLTTPLLALLIGCTASRAGDPGSEVTDNVLTEVLEPSEAEAIPGPGEVLKKVSSHRERGRVSNNFAIVNDRGWSHLRVTFEDVPDPGEVVVDIKLDKMGRDPTIAEDVYNGWTVCVGGRTTQGDLFIANPVNARWDSTAPNRFQVVFSGVGQTASTPAACAP